MGWGGEMNRSHERRLREGDADLVIQGTCRQFSELIAFPGNVIALAAVYRSVHTASQRYIHGTSCDYRHTTTESAIYEQSIFFKQGLMQTLVSSELWNHYG